MCYYNSEYFACELTCLYITFLLLTVHLVYRLGFILLRLVWELQRMSTTCKLIQEVTFYGSIVLAVAGVPRKVILVYAFSTEIYLFTSGPFYYMNTYFFKGYNCDNYLIY